MDRFDKLRETILPILLPYGAKRIGVFGSFARGDDTADSDVDLLVALKPPGERPIIGLRWFQLERELSETLGRRVDLVSEEALSPHLRPYVEKELRVLYEEG